MFETDEDRSLFLAQLMRHEGTKKDREGRHVAYRDTVGKWTIGYGHNLTDNPVPGIDRNSRLTDEQAESLLKTDVESHEREMLRRLPWAESVSGPRYAVLLNMAFNMGLPTLMTFKNTLGMIERGDYESAAAGMLNSKWAGQVKGRARELARQMRMGEWQEGA